MMDCCFHGSDIRENQQIDAKENQIGMEGDLKNIIKAWISVFASLSYCYLIGRRIPKGKSRLMSIIPVLCVFLLLPPNFSSIHLRGFTGFFLAWLANFKLLLFAFGQGPLSLDPSMPLLRFIFIAFLPIKIKHQSEPGRKTAKQNHPFPFPTRIAPNTPLIYSIKVILLVVLVRIYDYSQYIHPHIIRFFYCTHIYFGMEIVLTTVTYLSRLLLGLELEQTFNEPYLSTSLQDFWSRRWNIMVSKILHPTIYEPTRCLAVQLLGNKSESVSRMVALLNTFLVSGVMHELVYFYVGCWKPVWKTIFFFVLHGACLAAEVAVKKTFSKQWQLHPVVSWALVNGFLFVSISWLLLSEIPRCHLDTQLMSEYKALGGFIKYVCGFGAWHGPAPQ